ncbi:transporter substrate-binding domain-containing protein [Psychromonas aquimarina]|uniref:transporter substrate-binding domain-containing protein n=1 Tax=Psychromonas aquimarina TaxID=444919 RepID=UPI0003F5D404|nr:transporter substrate-binding domain-containing protein [Psychromonas aquimarina]
MQINKWIGNLLIFVCLSAAIPAQSNEVVIHKVPPRDGLVQDILSLILSKSDPQASIRQLSEELPEPRLIEEIQLGKVDLMWAGASPHLDEKLLTIRIPLYKGLLGHRIFIIKKEHQARFDDIKTLAQLKQLTAGQGTLWGDTKVLQDAAIPVVTTLKYPNLFYMLEGERFDYFPRAVHEPWDEVAARPELNLAVDKNVLLVYPFAMYFYVEKNNQALHDKLARGFEAAIADGSFDQLFLNHQMIKDALQKTNLKNRTVIRINNPNMHPDTPVDRPELWLDITSL